jgi:hypothetical protein
MPTADWTPNVFWQKGWILKALKFGHLGVWVENFSQKPPKYTEFGHYRG